MQESAPLDSVAGLLILAVYAALIIAQFAGMWMTFRKARREGWEALIPIWNLYACCKIGGVSGWWLLAFFIPLINILAVFYVFIAIANQFGKGTLFGIGLVFLGFIFWPILGFGKATYSGMRLE